MGVCCLAESPSCTVLAISSTLLSFSFFFWPIPFFCESLTHSFIHLFPAYLQLFLCISRLCSSSFSLKNRPLLSPIRTFSHSYLLPLLSLSLSIPFTSSSYSVSFPAFSLFFFCLRPFFINVFTNLLWFNLICFLYLQPLSFLTLSLTLSHSLCPSFKQHLSVLSISLLSVFISPSLSQTRSRASTSSCMTCVLSVMPSESPRRSDLIAWLSAPSTKTTPCWWSATAESCCGSLKPTPARRLPIPGIQALTHEEPCTTTSHLFFSRERKWLKVRRLSKVTWSDKILWA